MTKEAMKLALEALEKINSQALSDDCCGLLVTARKTLRETLAEQPAQQTCNCRWEGEVQVQECTLHQSHLLAIHEWAGRAKAAEAKLAQQPAPVGEPTKAMIDAAERIDWSDSDVRGNIVNMWQAMCAVAEQPAQQEPVAILNHAHGIHTVRSVKLNGLPDGEYNLYTPPQPPAPAPGFCKNCKDYTVEAPLAEQPAQRKPLTDKEIADIATSHPLTWVNLNTVEHRRYFARAIEAAHGIKGDA
jgi:hypothetical protein